MNPTFRRKNLALDVPSAVISQAFSLANIGESVALVKDNPDGVQAEKALDLGIRFVSSTSTSKPLGARVTGSWSKRAVFTRET